jgi:2-dehydro-3-deoxyphosphogluconate aldolase/(4S)-4-hydroxy-2-oxoglutarate aldolase
MTPSQTVYDRLETSGLMAGMRGDFPPEKALPLVEALLDEGITVFEFTMNSTRALEAMQAAKREFGEAACAGMGTVLDTHAAQEVIEAGADFIVSPAFSAEVVQLALGHDLFIAPGVLTPSECVDAWAMGVKMLKIFPIGPMGLDYFKSLRGPLDHMKFMANGGINAETTREFIAAGATCCGASSWLTGKGDWPLERIRDRARQLLAAVEAGRSGVAPRIVV